MCFIFQPKTARDHRQRDMVNFWTAPTAWLWFQGGTGPNSEALTLPLSDFQASAVVKGCFYQLRQLRSVQRSLTVDARRSVVTAFVAGHLDYFNTVLYSAAKTTIQRLQTVMNTAARLVGGLGKYDHIMPVLRDTLHWLLIQQRIEFKVAVLAFDCVRGTCPSSFCGICTPFTEIGGRVRLCSAHRGTYACHLRGQNLANAVSMLLHPEHGTLYHYISICKPSADNSSSLGSKLISSNAPTYDFYLQELLRSELTYLLTSCWCSTEGFYLTVFEHQTHLGKPLSRPSASNHNFLSNSSWGAWQNRWCPNSVTNLVNFLQYIFWENEFAVWIYHPLWRLRPTWPWVFNDVPTKFQRCSYLIGRAPRMNTLGSSRKCSDASGVTSKLTILWLGSTIW